MSTAAPTCSLAYDRMRLPGAVFEILVYLGIISAASLAFVVGWLTVNSAVVLTGFLLTSLIACRGSTSAGAVIPSSCSSARSRCSREAD
jgi:hypothetical protein